MPATPPQGAQGQLRAPPPSSPAPLVCPAGLESAQPHMLLQPIPTCLLSPDETTNPSPSWTVFLSVSPKGLEQGGTQQVRGGRQAARAD